MDSNIQLILISEVVTVGEIGEETIQQVRSAPIWGTKYPITRTEWETAGERDIKAEFRIDVYGFEYGGQRVCEIDSAKYGIYRTYSRPDSDIVELYLEEKGGVSRD